MDKAILDVFSKRADEAEAIIKTLTARIEQLEDNVKRSHAKKSAGESNSSNKGDQNQKKAQPQKGSASGSGGVSGVDAVTFDSFKQAVLDDLADIRTTIEEERAEAAKVCPVEYLTVVLVSDLPHRCCRAIKANLEKAQYRITHLVRSLNEEEEKSAKLAQELSKYKKA